MKPRLLAACLAALVTSLLISAPAPATPASTTAAVVVPPMPRAFTGYAFDACETPSQAEMDTWRTSSPFWGVGVYIAGANRLCATQANLTPSWVSTQASRGWRILPITVGRQASCNTYPSEINPDPTNSYAAARAQGRAEALTTVSASQSLGFAKGTTHWLDIEDFDLLNADCRRSMLGFVSGWTSKLHALGYKSGLYSNVAAGIKAVEGARTLSPGSYELPDQLWFAHFNGQVTTSTSVLAPSAWRHQRIHQYFGDSTRTYGGVALDIDLNWMDVGGGTRAPAPAPHCGVRIDFPSYGVVSRGDSGLKVKALQCLLKQQGVYAGKLNGSYNLATKQAVTRFQKKYASLTDTGITNRPTWMALLAKGSPSFSKVGSGSHAVRRIQRALNAAADEGLTVSGVFDRRTESAVKRYQLSRGLAATGVMTSTTWAPLQQGLR